MARVFPSQIRDFYDRAFPNDTDMSANFGAARMGAVTAFLALFERIPEELIRLPPKEYAELLESVGEINFRSKQYMHDAKAQVLGDVGRHVKRVRKLIDGLHDSVPSSTHDLAFIKDHQLREMIGLDLSAIATAMQSGEWKGATIIAGSCCETLLLYGLQEREAKISGTIQSEVNVVFQTGKKPPHHDLLHSSWDLFSYSTVAHQTKLISDNTKSALEPARDYRNLIHPAKAVREKTSFGRRTAFVGVGAVEHVIYDLQRNV